MIRQLTVHIDKFEGQECQTQCFAHILNLIAKSIIQQFDIQKAQANKVFDEATTALIVLAGDIDMEEQEMGVVKASTGLDSMTWTKSELVASA